MKVEKNASLLHHNTFGIEVVAETLIEYDSENELEQLLASDNCRSKSLLPVGAGSNLLFLSDFDGIVLHGTIRFIETVTENDDYLLLKVGAGTIWDDFVAFCVQNNYYGAENLSHIPGETGAAAVQNIGAYGAEVKDIIHEVHTIEIETGKKQTFAQEACRYAYRQSIFKRELKGQYIVVAVTFRLEKKEKYNPNYRQSETHVGQPGQPTLQAVRDAVIDIRRRKLPDPAVEKNAGSFFINPVVLKKQFDQLVQHYPDMPHYHVSDNEEKLSAAWLIDRCGWKGKQLGKVAVHNKQPLVIVNKGGASGVEIAAFAKQIQSSVEAKFGILLQPEVDYIAGESKQK
ncbi:MAG: UDP-N-acetylmuramate dehydrogenase [Prevotellaceae bacterium]|jgi:UDP-N-acetylmuramate dehydrogenase|nr:UDP-N-acetylmuramate dehydrogenase [Prevotellaceae bacterium]